MKKILTGCILTGMMLMGQNSLADKKIEVKENGIKWKVAGVLPAPKGYEKQFGVAAPLFGTIGDYVVVGGGANFPKGTVLEGGPKTYYPDLFLMKVGKNDKIEIVEHTMLPFETAHGSSFSTSEGIYYVGGNKQVGISKEILKVTLKDKKLKTEIVGELPFTFTNGAITVRNEKIYLMPGKVDGKDSKTFYEYDLKTKKVKELAEFPGEVRSQASAQILGKDGKEKMYVFSGMSNVCHTDGFAYDFKTNKWEKVADIVIDGKAITLAGGTSTKINDEEMLVIGGVNKGYFDNAVAKLGSLKDEALAAFKTEYFNADPQDYQFNEHIAIYNAKKNQWRSGGKVPFLPPAGAAVVVVDDEILSINGEIKAGVRSDRIYIGDLD